MRDSARVVIYAIAGYLYLVTLLGAYLLAFGPKDRVTDAMLTAMIVGPMGTALGYLGGILARTEKPDAPTEGGSPSALPASPQPVEIVDPPTQPVPTKDQA